MRTALFWVVTQRVEAISYRRFGTTYRPHLGLEDGTDFVPKRRQAITITRCVTTQKSAVLIHFAAEALSLTFILGYTYEPWESKKSRRGK